METNNRIRLDICTLDEALYQRLSRLAALWGEEKCVRLDVYQAQEGGSEDTDLFFSAPGGAGIERWAAQRQAAGRPSALVALVENSRQAIASYRCHPNALLQLDTDLAGLSAALDRCFSVWSRGMIWLDLLYHREPVRTPLCQVQYVEAQGRNTILHCDGGAIEVNKPLGRVAELLPQPPFLRCQKSFLVRLSAVARVQSGTLVMTDGREIPISRKQVPAVRKLVEGWNARIRG